jgi:hypothetical protein
MHYDDFVYFMLSEEDKGNKASLQYWFACVDIDGDGKVTPQDMRFFYDVQTSRMESLGHDVVSFSDVLCQMSDMIKPGKVSEGGDQFLFFRFSFFLFFLLDFFVDSDDQLMLTEKQNKN